MLRSPRLALLTRPQWQGEETPRLGDARLLHAPLQTLERCPVAIADLEAIFVAPDPWLVCTSPASVQALQAWLKEFGNHLLAIPGLRFAAVGSGTRDQLAKRLAVESRQIICPPSDEAADANGLLAVFDSIQRTEGFDWSAQTLLIVEGQNNRPTLGDGLRARGAEVIAVGFYARHDQDWESTIWDRFKQYAHSELAVIVTSTGVIDRLLGQCRARGIDPTQLLWCTQHPTIAARLRQAGCEQLRRVRLDPQFLTGDLFDHEFGW